MVPVAAVKSEPAVAVPSTVSKRTVTAVVAACDSVRAKPSSMLPPLPSVTVASAIETVGRTGRPDVAPFRVRWVTSWPPGVAAWKPKEVVAEAATLPFHPALRMT